MRISGELANRSVLDLSSQGLAGEIPQWLGVQMDQLLELDLSYNESVAWFRPGTSKEFREDSGEDSR